jgi:hypothetical protein
MTLAQSVSDQCMECSLAAVHTLIEIYRERGGGGGGNRQRLDGGCQRRNCSGGDRANRVVNACGATASGWSWSLEQHHPTSQHSSCMRPLILTSPCRRETGWIGAADFPGDLPLSLIRSQKWRCMQRRRRDRATAACWPR